MTLKTITLSSLILFVLQLGYGQNRPAVYTETINGANFNLVTIPSGEFMMGCTWDFILCADDELPVHRVQLESYYMTETEVTQRQWRAIMGENVSRHIDCNECPVENVSWYDIQRFIERLNGLSAKHYRLPTEQEWEYAARGGESYVFSGSDDLDRVAWNELNSGGRTHPVKTKQANAYGLYDMTGNVWELCGDVFKHYPNSKANYVPDGVVYCRRGASIYVDAPYSRLSHRMFSAPTDAYPSIGFRLVAH